jgi:uncharacterized damage-inducible protein DinB
MNVNNSSELIETNIGLLQQAIALLDRLDDSTFSTSPKGLEPHRVGSHLRHVLEFYDSFLRGQSANCVDYDARVRDQTLETSRRAATARILFIIDRLEELSSIPDDTALAVRVENGDPDVSLRSSIGRELQALSSHTIHHFALISVTLRLHGVEVDPNFGMSPSTLRFQAAQRAEIEARLVEAR